MHQSLSCPSFFLQPVARHTGNSYQPGLGPVGGAVCPETGAKFKVGGPIWSEPIHDASWVEEALARVADDRQRVADDRPCCSVRHSGGSFWH